MLHAAPELNAGQFKGFMNGGTVTVRRPGDGVNRSTAYIVVSPKLRTENLCGLRPKLTEGSAAPAP